MYERSREGGASDLESGFQKRRSQTGTKTSKLEIARCGSCSCVRRSLLLTVTLLLHWTSRCAVTIYIVCLLEAPTFIDHPFSSHPVQKSQLRDHSSCRREQTLYTHLQITQHQKTAMMMDTNMTDSSRTPIANPTRKPTLMSQAQKQALIDNLQLEGEVFQALPPVMNQHIL